MKRRNTLILLALRLSAVFGTAFADYHNRFLENQKDIAAGSLRAATGHIWDEAGLFRVRTRGLPLEACSKMTRKPRRELLRPRFISE